MTLYDVYESETLLLPDPGIRTVNNNAGLKIEMRFSRGFYAQEDCVRDQSADINRPETLGSLHVVFAASILNGGDPISAS